MKKWLQWQGIFALSFGVACGCQAAGSAIYQHQTSDGAVELSNLAADDEGQPLVAPADPDAMDSQAGLAKEGARAVPGAEGSVDSAGVAARPENRAPINSMRSDDVAGGAPLVMNPAALSSVSSSYGGGALPAGTGSGTQASGVTEPTSGQAVAGLPTSGSGTTPPSVLDSPAALEARLAQYRQLMLNEPLGPNGLPPNPAVVRRYLMVNRSGYMSGR